MALFEHLAPVAGLVDGAALADAEVRRKAEAAGLQLRGGTPAEFSAFISSETRKWAQIIQAANITAE